MRLTDRSVGDVVKAYAGRAGFDANLFSGHSLRSGFLTSAAAKGASIFKMMDVSRHKSVDTLRGYVRDAECSRIMREQGYCKQRLLPVVGRTEIINVDRVVGSPRAWIGATAIESRALAPWQPLLQRNRNRSHYLMLTSLGAENGTSAMRKDATSIDRAFRRAIIQDIGERLRAFLREEPELSASLRRQIDQLREVEDGSPSIMPDANSGGR